jgi:hypothetical protein
LEISVVVRFRLISISAEGWFEKFDCSIEIWSN